MAAQIIGPDRQEPVRPRLGLRHSTPGGTGESDGGDGPVAAAVPIKRSG